MIFLALSGKVIFFFPKNMISFCRLTFLNKKKEEKIHGNMMFSSNVLKRWSSQKKSDWNKSYLYYSFVISRKTAFFS